ncbi:DUF551 domain-containing protein [Cronobacter sakazakii]
MSTISNDVLEKLSVRYRLLAKIHDGSESQAWEESALIVEELLALRKERERAETVGVPDLHKVVYHFRDLNEGFPVERFKADYVIAWMLANYPPAPSIADDSLPYDPQIAEYEQMMEAEQAQADTTSQQCESLAGKAVSGWIPCSERLPDLKQEILCVNQWGEVEAAIYDVGYIPGEPFFATSAGEFYPTHWHALPELPCK